MSGSAIVVTIDGPAGAGKSTVAKLAARRLGYLYVDTGALYRAVAWQASRLGLGPDDPGAVEAMMDAMDLRMEPAEGGVRVWVDGVDATADLRTPAISQLASSLSALPGVRQRLMEMQRGFGRRTSVVVEGRDTGTVIFPHAHCKVYLDADLRERARRRLGDLRRTGHPATIEDVIADVRARDERDMGRDIAPLRPAEDAQVVDTTGLTIEQVVDRIVVLARAAAEREDP